MQNYDNLNKLGIYYLRDIGRKVGVKDVTLLKKAELVENITKVLNKEIEPYFKKTAQGRPHKEVIENFNLLDFIKEKNDFNIESYKNIRYQIIYLIYLENYHSNVLKNITELKNYLISFEKSIENNNI